MGTRLATCVGVFALAVGLAAPTVAAADDAEQARAEFRRGMAAGERGDWSGAAERFRAALELRWSPVIAFNLAKSLVELGQLAEADALLMGVAAGSEELRGRAERFRATIAPRLAHLTIRWDALPAGAHVYLGDRRLERADVGRALTLDPGPYRVVVMAGERELQAHRVVLSEGATLELDLGDEAGSDASQEPASALATTQDSPMQRGPVDAPSANGERPYLPSGILLGVGAASLVLAATFGLLARDLHAELEGICPGLECTEDVESRADTLDRRARLGDGFLGVGGALVLIGAGLAIATAVRRRPPDSPTVMGLACSARGCVGSVRRRF